VSVRLVVVDDHEMVRRGIVSVLAGSGIDVVGEAADIGRAVRIVRQTRPDVVLLDARLGTADGIAAVKDLRAAVEGVRVVVFSAFDSPTYIARAVSAGAHDYLLKTASRDALITAITDTARDRPPRRLGEFRRIAASMSNKSHPGKFDVPLTPREIQTLRLVAMGLSNQEIADSLEISIETVKEHVQNLLRKLGLGDRTQAAVWALRHGLA
jgi:DNA-binding NarL/FixJ family response regulator